MIRLSGAVCALALIVSLATSAHAQELRFDRYHSAKETVAALERLVRDYPDRIKIEVIGKSGQGRPLHVATITDFKSGKPNEKPGIFIEGNIHGNERIGGEAALRLIDRLVTDDDETIAALRKLRTFYVLPKANPDAADVWARGILKPEDDDDDGKDDEDGPEDVNGDGIVTYMRVENPEGDWIPDRRDPRLMNRYSRLTVKQRKRYRGPRYDVYTEGIDNDDDGEINEDGPDWEIDPNRDFPADLKAERKYRKKYARHGATRQGGRRTPRSRGKKQEPEFLRSEEVKASVKFLRAHPSIALCISFHSYGNVLFRPFGYIPDRQGIPRQDRRLFDEIAGAFRAKTGFEAYGPPYLGERQVVGGLHDFTYLEMGCPGVTAEIWGVPGVGRDWAERDRRRNRGRRRRGGSLDNSRKMLQYVDLEQIKDGYVEWSRFQHPSLGEVEIGGLWQTSRFQYNPPPSRIESVVDPFVDFAFEAAQITPLARIMNLAARRTKERVYMVQAEVMNIGRAPTNWKLAEKRKIAVDDVISVELPAGARLSSGRSQKVIGTMAPGKSVRLRWTVVVPEATKASTKITVVLKTKMGGTHRRELELAENAAQD